MIFMANKYGVDKELKDKVLDIVPKRYPNIEDMLRKEKFKVGNES